MRPRFVLAVIGFLALILTSALYLKQRLAPTPLQSGAQSAAVPRLVAIPQRSTSELQPLHTGVPSPALDAGNIGGHFQSLLDPHDLPPSPSDMPASAPTYAEKEMQRYRQDLSVASTNQAEQALASEIKALEQKLADLEKVAYAKDPLLRAYGQYRDKVHDWVQENRQGDSAVRTSYYTKSSDPEVLKQLQQTDTTLRDLMEMLITEELGTNPNFAPLLESTFELYEAAMPDNSRFVTRGVSYWRLDRLIGFRSPTRPERVTLFTDYLAEIGKRHDLLTAKLVAIERDQAVPPGMVDAMKYDVLYHLVDGADELYLEARTPVELQKAREDLQMKYRDYILLVRNQTHAPVSPQR